MDKFIIHGCEQVLRFSRINKWDDLSEGQKVQLGFNMGVMSLGLNLTKEDGYLSLVKVREGSLSIQDFNEKMRSLINSRNVLVNEENIKKPII